MPLVYLVPCDILRSDRVPLYRPVEPGDPIVVAALIGYAASDLLCSRRALPP